jgi:hypothetical protein
MDNQSLVRFGYPAVGVSEMLKPPQNEESGEVVDSRKDDRKVVDRSRSDCLPGG